MNRGPIAPPIDEAVTASDVLVIGPAGTGCGLAGVGAGVGVGVVAPEPPPHPASTADAAIAADPANRRRRVIRGFVR